MFRSVVVLFLGVIFSACGGSSSEPELTCEQQRELLEKEIHNDLDTLETDADFTLAIKSYDGRFLTHSRGSSTLDTVYESASTSKMVSAVVILNEVKKGNLSLDDVPQKYIGFWPTSGNRALIKLHDLLSFTSGLEDGLLLWGSDFDDAVSRISDNNDEDRLSGEKFYYGSAHLQVAGLMAINASTKTTWNELFDAFKTETGLFNTALYDLPNSTNPRLAGGMHWKATEYLAFLEKLYKKEILTPELINAMMSDQRALALTENSPVIDGINEDWHYGFGVWVESASNPFDATKVTGRVSSPGLYGAYPFIDYKYKYYGILARQGGNSTFTKGYELFKSVAPKLENWATSTCQ